MEPDAKRPRPDEATDAVSGFQFNFSACPAVALPPPPLQPAESGGSPGAGADPPAADTKFATPLVQAPPMVPGGARPGRLGACDAVLAWLRANGAEGIDRLEVADGGAAGCVLRCRRALASRDWLFRLPVREQRGACRCLHSGSKAFWMSCELSVPHLWLSCDEPTSRAGRFAVCSARRWRGGGPSAARSRLSSSGSPTHVPVRATPPGCCSGLRLCRIRKQVSMVICYGRGARSAPALIRPGQWCSSGRCSWS
jgi:hypothetical protein